MSCHILHGMIEDGLTKKKIFDQKYKESTQGREDVTYKSAAEGVCQTRSCISKATLCRRSQYTERRTEDNVKKVRQSGHDKDSFGWDAEQSNNLNREAM